MNLNPASLSNKPPIRTKSFFMWKSLLLGWDLCKQGSKRNVRTGENINFCYDHWLNGGNLRSLIQGPLRREENLKISNLLFSEIGISTLFPLSYQRISLTWSIQHLFRSFHPSLAAISGTLAPMETLTPSQRIISSSIKQSPIPPFNIIRIYPGFGI